MKGKPLLEMIKVSKSYPGVRALKEVDFDLYEGEVHFLLGENGAGKSTLMKILSGSVQKDGGSIKLEGVEIEIGSPANARKYGIAMVYQEFSLLPSLSVAENIFLGNHPLTRRGKLVDWRKMKQRTKEILSMVGLDLPPGKPVRELSVSERQLVEIAKALSQNARVLLLDEPTSALSAEEVGRLFQLIRDLQKRGIAVIYVSHRLGEVQEIAQRVTVLRDGNKIGTLPVEEAAEAILVKMMVGREITEQYPRVQVNPGEPALEVQGLKLKNRLKDVSFTLKQGEIVGVFGLMGAGRTSLANVLFGLERPEAGVIKVNGKEVRINEPMEAIRAGIGYITEDRRSGLVYRMGVAPNITFPSLKELCRAGIMRLSRERELAGKYVRELRINTPSIWQLCEYLSGGNQQKVLLGRWICTQSKVLLLDEPTRGIDVGSKVEVYRLMGRLAAQGTAILMFSSELPEVMGLCHRILVMSEGRIAATLEPERTTPEEIMLYATGGMNACG